MDFNKLPIATQLQLIFNDLSNCHVMGSDALQFGSALKALEQTIETCNKEAQSESVVQ